MERPEAQTEIKRILCLDMEQAWANGPVALEDNADNAFQIVPQGQRDLLLWAPLCPADTPESDALQLQDVLTHAFSVRTRFQSKLVYQESEQTLGLMLFLSLPNLSPTLLRAAVLDFHQALRHWKQYFSQTQRPKSHMPLTHLIP